MLSDEEKQEMIEDARSEVRREHFRATRRVGFTPESLDDYILFLNSIQKIFSAFKTNPYPTPTKLNRL